MERAFIDRVLGVRTFNIRGKDFESTKYKKEVQHIIGMHYFPKFNLDKTLNKLDQNRFNQLVEELRTESPMFLDMLHNIKPSGIGPGEVLLYFLLNNAYLGGGSSAGVDLIDGSTPYEVKAVDINTKNEALNFKVGGKTELAAIQAQLAALCKKYKLPGDTSSVTKSTIDRLKQIAPQEFKFVEDMYIDAVYGYFKGHKVIFIQNTGKSKMSRIAAIKEVQRKDITMERVTSNTIKPLIKL